MSVLDRAAVFDSKLSREVETVRWSQRKVLTRHRLLVLWGNKRRLGLSVAKERVSVGNKARVRPGHQEATDDEVVVDLYLRVSHKFI